MRCLAALLLASVVIASATLPAAADINDGLVAYYPFDGNASDSSTFHNDGVPQGGSMAYEPGVVGQAARFTGLNYIQAEDAEQLRPASISVCAWVTVDEGTTAQNTYDAAHVVTKGSIYGCRGPDFGLRLGSRDEALDNHILFETMWGPPGGSYGSWVIGELVPQGRWVHVCGVFADGVSHIYFNGIIQGSAQYDHAALDSWAVPRYIGAR